MQRALLGDLDVTFWTEQRGQRARDELRQVADQRDRRVVIFGPGQ